MSEGGVDSEGNTYSSIEELWASQGIDQSRGDVQISEEESRLAQEAVLRWYQTGASYWKNEEASVSGMLGGLTQVHPADVQTSLDFLQSLKVDRLIALDCGAGIGRVTEHVLGLYFNSVDLVEQDRKYLRKAEQNLSGKPFAGEFHCCGLQDFVFAKSYSCIWIQWVISHLTDSDCIAFLKRCRTALAPNGFIVLKENTSRKGFYLDCQDLSVTRSDGQFRLLFEQAGLTLEKSLKQPGFPRELFPVQLYALR